MERKIKVLILGKGRIGRGIAFFLQKKSSVVKIAFFPQEKKVEKFDILIGALPGKIGDKGLEFALKYRKDLIDVADLEIEFYLKKKKEIEAKNILVIPNAGFCPGLINLILKKEIDQQKTIQKIEVKVGTLSLKPFFFPFLWSFEDLILEHKMPCWQIISGKKKKFPPFSSYQKEKFFGILAESYFGVSDFDHFINPSLIKNFTFRLIRPFGFFYFFQFLKNHGFLENVIFNKTKSILERRKEDNLTLAEIQILTNREKITWDVKAFSKKMEKLNSMQKATALTPVILIDFLIKGKIQEKGIVLMEDLGRKEDFFEEFLEKIKKAGIDIKRELKPLKKN